MATKVVMPLMGEAVEEATLTKWLKAEGEAIAEYDPLVEINTDKVDSELPSPVSGTLLKILVAEDATVPVGTLLAWIGEPGEEIPADDGQTSPEAIPVHEPEPPPTPAPAAAPTLVAAPRPVDLKPGRSEQGFISPLVARIASENNVDLSHVAGTGREGRITKKDILFHIETRGVAPSTPAPAKAPASSSEMIPGAIIPHSVVRRRIAEHMVKSIRTSPHVTTVMEADLANIVAHRKANKPIFARDSVNLTYTAYFMAASAAALKTYPVANSSWSEEGLILHKAVNLGMAVSMGEAGLIVPVIKDADTLSLLGIAKAVNDLAHRARNKQLKPGEVQGGTFTITNHGISGSLFAVPIINQPQCAILGVGAIQKRAVVIHDAIAIRPMAYLSLTFDHRILDGAIADYFLAEVVKTLEAWN